MEQLRAVQANKKAKAKIKTRGTKVLYFWLPKKTHRWNTIDIQYVDPQLCGSKPSSSSFHKQKRNTRTHTF